MFLSIRMNDGHYPENITIHSAFTLKNSGGRDGYALDFSLKAVQNHFCQYIEELL